MEDELEQLDAKTNQKLVRTCLYYYHCVIQHDNGQDLFVLHV